MEPEPLTRSATPPAVFTYVRTVNKANRMCDQYDIYTDLAPACSLSPRHHHPSVRSPLCLFDLTRVRRATPRMTAHDTAYPVASHDRPRACD